MGGDARRFGLGGWTRSPRAPRRGVARVAAGLLALLGAPALAMPPVPEPPENPITEPKRVLGKMLFWDEQLSSSNTVSCGTCHSMKRGGGDDRLVRGPGQDGVTNTPDDVFGSLGVIRADGENNFEPDPVFSLAPQMTGRASNSPQNAAYSPVQALARRKVRSWVPTGTATGLARGIVLATTFFAIPSLAGIAALLA